jgi:hypothetical protein
MAAVVTVALSTSFLLYTTPAHAQSVTGSISGSVVDASKQIVPGALVTLVDEQTGALRMTASGDGGRFVFSSNQPGLYTVRLDSETVTTVADVALVQTASSMRSTMLTDTQLETLAVRVPVEIYNLFNSTQFQNVDTIGGARAGSLGIPQRRRGQCVHFELHHDSACYWCYVLFRGPAWLTLRQLPEPSREPWSTPRVQGSLARQ